MFWRIVKRHIDFFELRIEGSWFWSSDISITLLGSFHEGLAASSGWFWLRGKFIKTFSEATTFWLFINFPMPTTFAIEIFVFHPLKSQGKRAVQRSANCSKCFFWSWSFSFVFYCNPAPLPAFLSIIHSGWWRGGLETTTTITLVAKSPNQHNQKHQRQRYHTETNTAVATLTLVPSMSNTLKQIQTPTPTLHWNKH